MRTTIVIPTLNELSGLKDILPQIKREWYDQIVILDGKSDDGTEKWYIQNWEEMLGRNIQLFTQIEKGLWNAYRELFLSNVVEGEIVITLSPDFNCPPSDIPKLKEKIESGYDMVIASRYKNGTKSLDDTKLTAFGNHLLTGVCNVLIGASYSDALNMYRAYRTSIINQLGFTEKPNLLQRQLAKMTSLYSFEPSLSIRAWSKHLKVCEISSSEPMAYRERRQNTLVHGSAILTQILYEGLIK